MAALSTILSPLRFADGSTPLDCDVLGATLESRGASDAGFSYRISIRRRDFVPFVALSLAGRFVVSMVDADMLCPHRCVMYCYPMGTESTLYYKYEHMWQAYACLLRSTCTNWNCRFRRRCMSIVTPSTVACKCICKIVSREAARNIFHKKQNLSKHINLDLQFGHHKSIYQKT